MPFRCSICGTSASLRPPTGDLADVTCPRCGNYRITDTTVRLLLEPPITSPGAISGWIRRQNALGVTPRIDSDTVPMLRALTKPPFRERVERFLVLAAETVRTLDQWFKPGEPEFIGVSYSDSQQELVVIIDYLKQEGLLTNIGIPQGEHLTAKGYIAADELRAKRAASSQAFVSMWLDVSMQSIYERGLSVGIRSAGFSPLLIPKKEHANKIDDEIIAEIRRSAFIVADFTGQRQNVYFETGFAIGLGFPVIWTCRQDEIKNLHFDIRQYNSIDWKDEGELAIRLQRRIEAMLGRGPGPTTST
jgi:hypothetical protein